MGREREYVIYPGVGYCGCDDFFAVMSVLMLMRLNEVNHRLQRVEQGVSGLLPLMKTWQLVGDRLLRILRNGSCAHNFDPKDAAEAPNNGSQPGSPSYTNKTKFLRMGSPTPTEFSAKNVRCCHEQTK